MSAESMTERLPFGAGAAAGGVAWVLTYLFTYLITASDIRNSLLGRILEAGDVGVWQAVGWVFFNAHFVSTTVDLGFFGSGALNAVGGEDGFTPLLYIIPPLLLVGAGLAVGRYAGADGMDAANAAFAGATPVLGYGLLSVVGVFVFATENVTPDLVTGILLAGVLYPLVFGAVGGLVARSVGG